MIVRLRSNLEIKRLTLGPAAAAEELTLGKLKAAIQAAYCLPSTDKIHLSLDSEGLQRICGPDGACMCSSTLRFAQE